MSSQAELVGKFEADTEMERAIQDLLTHAKADKEAKVSPGRQAARTLTHSHGADDAIWRVKGG